eukprot:scaffold31556_cov62-Attheya_sp.AAC.3
MEDPNENENKATAAAPQARKPEDHDNSLISRYHRRVKQRQQQQQQEKQQLELITRDVETGPDVPSSNSVEPSDSSPDTRGGKGGKQQQQDHSTSQKPLIHNNGDDTSSYRDWRFQPEHQHQSSSPLWQNIRLLRPVERALSERLLEEALSDVGQYSFGIVAVEVWALSDDHTLLQRPPGGWWQSHLLSETEPLKKLQQMPAGPVYPGVGLAGILWLELAHLSKNGRLNNWDQMSVSSGGSSLSRMFSSRNLFRRGGGGGNVSGHDNLSPSNHSQGSFRRRMQWHLEPPNPATDGSTNNQNKTDDNDNNPRSEQPSRGLRGGRRGMRLVWRSVHSMAIDPDRQPDVRLTMMDQAGLGKATGVPFDVGGQRGLVVYLARSSAQEAQLQDPTNVAFLRTSAMRIGSLVALESTRRASILTKRQRNRHTLRRSLSAFLHHSKQPDNTQTSNDPRNDPNAKTIKKTNLSHPFQEKHNEFLGNLEPEGVIGREDQKKENDPSGSRCASFCAMLWDKLPFCMITGFNDVRMLGSRVMKKSKGANLQPPPPTPLRQSVWTFLCVLITLLILILCVEAFERRWNTSQLMIWGPFGALMTLQYGLTGAPASQPRNILYGHLVSGVIAIGFSYIPIVFLPLGPRIALATATAIGSMSQLGIIHPPAGALALLLASSSSSSSDHSNWYLLLASLLASLISIVMAAILNNMNVQRQYPIYWKLVPEQITLFFTHCYSISPSDH